MTWDAIGALGEIGGAVAVLVTLLYLARQIRQSNRQALLASFQHTFDSLNGWASHVSASADLPPIILRGRQSYESLDDADRFRFDHVHFQLLNMIESHHFQVHQTALDEEYRKWAMDNLAKLAAGYFAFPGTRAFWGQVAEYYPRDVQRLISENLGDT